MKLADAEFAELQIPGIESAVNPSVSINILTAAVRDLHLAHPGRFGTDVRTRYPELWEDSPHLTPLRDNDPEAERLTCHYPPIHPHRGKPAHFLSLQE